MRKQRDSTGSAECYESATYIGSKVGKLAKDLKRFRERTAGKIDITVKFLSSLSR